MGRRIIYDRSKRSKGTRRRIKQGCSTKDRDERITTTTGNKEIASLVIAITTASRQELGMIFTWVLVYTQCKGLKDIIVNRNIFSKPVRIRETIQQPMLLC